MSGYLAEMNWLRIGCIMGYPLKRTLETFCPCYIPLTFFSFLDEIQSNLGGSQLNLAYTNIKDCAIIQSLLTCPRSCACQIGRRGPSDSPARSKKKQYRGAMLSFRKSRAFCSGSRFQVELIRLMVGSNIYHQYTRVHKQVGKVNAKAIL